MATEFGLRSIEPKTGMQLWEYEWPMQGAMTRITQPAVINNSEILFGAAMGLGTKRLTIGQQNGEWTVKERWASLALKPEASDGILFKDHFYGFDGSFFICMELGTGKAVWKSRSYGSGQVLSLQDQELLIVISQNGQAAMIRPNPAELQELGRFQAIQGQTWNHPVVANGCLYVRNSKEAACYRLD